MAITVNPFSTLGKEHNAGLDSVVLCVTNAPEVTIDQMVQCTLTYIDSVYGSALNAISNLELSVIIQDAINGYINAKAGGGLNYNNRQEFFIFQLLEGIHDVPSFGMKQYIEDIEENIVQSGMSSADQNQLLMATAIGKADFDYWVVIANQGGEYQAWDSFTNKLGAPTPNLISYVVSASMEATLYAQKHRSNATVLDVASTNGANSVAALAASIGVVAGIPMFAWVQKPSAPNC